MGLHKNGSVAKVVNIMREDPSRVWTATHIAERSGISDAYAYAVLGTLVRRGLALRVWMGGYKLTAPESASSHSL